MPEGGFFILFDEPRRRDALAEIIDDRGTFRETISAEDWDVRAAEIVLISLEAGELSYLALGRRGGKAGTLKYSLRLSHFMRVDPPVILSELAADLPGRVRPHLVRVSKGEGSRIPETTWSELLRALLRARPQLKPELEELRRLRDLPDRQRGGVLRVPPAIVHERDSVNLALRFGRVPPQAILGWADDYSAGFAPFLRGLGGLNIREDPMIQHDMRVFGDWRFLSQHQAGFVVLGRGRHRMAVMNVNRTRVEETLGVDLIYYHEQFKSYVMVQYKRMIDEDGVAGYRPLDESYKKELERMLHHAADFEENAACTHVNDFRLHCSPFYFKLCPAGILEPLATDMIKGMYLPLAFWSLLVSGDAAKGPKGGTRVTYDAAGRFLNNDLFVRLVQDGWIGSRVRHTETISDLIRDALDGGDSVILARNVE